MCVYVCICLGYIQLKISLKYDYISFYILLKYYSNMNIEKVIT